MKRIAWITVLALAALVVANGMTTEVPATKAPGGYGGGVAGAAVREEAKQPETEAPAAFAGGVSQAARAPQGQPAITETPPAFGGFAATSRTGRSATQPPTAPASRRAMGFAATTPRPRPPGTELRRTFKFKLFDIRTGATYGPFVMRDEGRITIGEKQYVIQVVEGFKEVEELRTPEQTALEAKLHRVILPEMKFEEARLTEALDFLSREADVNIVVVDRVREAALDVTIRLRNVPLYDAIRYVTEVIGVHFRIDDHAVVITDRPTSSRAGR